MSAPPHSFLRMFGWFFFLFGDRGIQSARVEPGDSIVVPVLYQIAVTAGVLIVVF